MSPAEEVAAILHMDLEDGGDLEHFVLKMQEHRDLITCALQIQEKLRAPMSHFTANRLSIAFMGHLATEWPEAFQIVNSEPVAPRAISSAIDAAIREAIK